MKKVVFCIVFALLSIELAFSQTVLSLDDAIKSGAIEIESRLNQGVKVVVLNFNSPSVRFSNYVMDEMMTFLVMSEKITVVDRFNLELIQQEMNFQSSGEVSDSSAQAIGQKLGAQSIISGSIEDLGNFYRIRFRTIEVETATIQVLTSVNIFKDNQVFNLMGSTSRGNVSTRPPRQPRDRTTFADDWSKSHWLSLEANIAGAGLRYEYMFNNNFSLGANGYYQTFGLTWVNFGVELISRYYPFGKIFYLGLGLGFNGYEFTYEKNYGEWIYDYGIGFGISPEIGVKFNFGRQGNLFLDIGYKNPLTIGGKGGFAVNTVPHIGFGIVF